MKKDIRNTPLNELIDEINTRLKGNPKAVQLVYSFLMGYTEGAGEKVDPAENDNNF